jgi:hypothetical protein
LQTTQLVRAERPRHEFQQGGEMNTAQVTYSILLFTAGWVVGLALFLTCFPFALVVSAFLPVGADRLAWLMYSIVCGGMMAGPYILWKVVRKVLAEGTKGQALMPPPARNETTWDSLPRWTAVKAYLSAVMCGISSISLLTMLIRWPYPQRFLDVFRLMVEGTDHTCGYSIIALVTGATAIVVGNGAIRDILGKVSSVSGAVVLGGLYVFAFVTW